MMRRKKMKMSDQYVDSVLAEAQKLLWGGSETENIQAHNLISKLIKDRMDEGKGQNDSL
jgi:hypothetical protein